jgi:hypothetical protein
MAPRSRFNLMFWIYLPSGFGLICATAYLVRHELLVFALPYFLFTNFKLHRILCPRCGKPLARVADKVRSISRYQALIPKECDQCGERLDLEPSVGH